MINDQIRERWQAALQGRKQSTEEAVALFRDYIALMADLRSAAGCPWDSEQSLASLRQYVLEEAAEVCEAIDRILDAEAEIRGSAGLSPANPAPPDGSDRARTATKGLTIAHHPHQPDFRAEHSASGAPLPPLDDTSRARLDKLYMELAKELGDLLLQPLFQCDILTGMGRPGIEYSLRLALAKLIGRHPHVYGDLQVADSAEVLANWEQIKQTEDIR